MPDTPSISSPVSDFNPLASGQFQLRGGWKSFWSTTIGYTILVGAGLLLVVRLSDGTPGSLFGLKTAFTGLQAGLLVLFVATRVSTAIRQDQTSRMIESHRLMPMSPPQAVLGYLLGPSAQPLAICAANLLLGVMLCQAVGSPVVIWLTVNVVLLLFGAFGTVLAAFGAFSGRPGGAAVGWIASLVGLVNFFTIGSILPAVNVLATPLLGTSIFNMTVAGRDAVATYAPSTVFQLLIAGVCFAAACRRYRRDDRPGLGWDLGLALLAAWIATSAFGIAHWQSFAPSVTRGNSVDAAAQFLGSTISAMLLALVPLAGSAWLSADWERRRAAGDPPGGRHPPAPPVVALATAVITLLLVFVAPAPAGMNGAAGNPADNAGSTAAVGLTAGVVLSFSLAASYLLRVLARVTGKLLFPLLTWLMLTNFLPILADYVRWWLKGLPDEPMLGAASAFGPLGALIQIWTADPTVTIPGIAIQILLAAGMATAYYGTRNRRRKKRAAPAE